MDPLKAFTNSFRFRLSTNLRFGIGETQKLGEEITELGFKKVAAIVDAGVANHPQVQKAFAVVQGNAVSIDIFTNRSVEPDYDFLDSFKKQFVNKGYDCLIGIGGGSTLDLTKGVATLLANAGKAISYRGFPKLVNKPLPVIAIPTTAGTGSEVTYNAVFTDSEQKKKLGINSILNFPICAIIDPLITVDCPKSVTVSSGVDAMVHTLESFAHRNHTPVSRMFSKEAFRLLFPHLSKVVDNPKDVNARAALALGSYLAAIALMNSGSGPSAALSYPLGVHYHVPHGYAGGIFLTKVTNLNIERGFVDYAELFDLINHGHQPLTMEEKTIAFGKELQRLWDKIEIPKSLTHFGLTHKDREFMVAQYDVLKAAIDQNPISFSKADIQRIMDDLA